MKCPHLDRVSHYVLRYHLCLSNRHVDECCGGCWEKLIRTGHMNVRGVWNSELTRDVILILEGFE